MAPRTALRTLVAGAAALTVATTAFTISVLGAPAPASAAAQQSAATLYREALASTKSWYVHYSSSSTSNKVTLVEHGNAGPASGTQSIEMGKNRQLNDSATIDVIGDTTYVRGNVAGLEALAGLSATQANEAAGRWIQFSTDNTDFSDVVAGVRSQDLAQELALKGPLKLGRQRTVDGYKVDAIEGTQTLGHKSIHVVLYVRADGPHDPVEEDSLNAKGQRTTAEHIAYSSWGETVRPKAPQASLSIGSTHTV